MRQFIFPARYARFVESTLALAGAEIKRDASRREDDDERVQQLATIPDAMLDPAETGEVIIMVTVPNSDALGDETRLLQLSSGR